MAQRGSRRDVQAQTARMARGTQQPLAGESPARLGLCSRGGGHYEVYKSTTRQQMFVNPNPAETSPASRSLGGVLRGHPLFTLSQQAMAMAQTAPLTTLTVRAASQARRAGVCGLQCCTQQHRLPGPHGGKAQKVGEMQHSAFSRWPVQNEPITFHLQENGMLVKYY